MGKSSIAAAAEHVPAPILRVELEYYIAGLGGSQPSIIENKEPWSFQFDYASRMLTVIWRRDGFEQRAEVPFERVKSIIYEKVPIHVPVRQSA